MAAVVYFWTVPRLLMHWLNVRLLPLSECNRKCTQQNNQTTKLLQKQMILRTRLNADAPLRYLEIFIDSIWSKIEGMKCSKHAYSFVLPHRGLAFETFCAMWLHSWDPWSCLELPTHLVVLPGRKEMKHYNSLHWITTAVTPKLNVMHWSNFCRNILLPFWSGAFCIYLVWPGESFWVLDK